MSEFSLVARHTKLFCSSCRTVKAVQSVVDDIVTLDCGHSRSTKTDLSGLDIGKRTNHEFDFDGERA